MKHPPRFAQRCRPPREPQPGQPRRLIAGAIFVAGFAIAVLGAFHEVGSTGKEPTTHLQPYSPLPTAGSFQVLGNPESTPRVEATTSPTAVLQLRQQAQPTPALTVASPPPVQVWSSANVLMPAGPEAVVAATNVGASTPTYNASPIALQADPTATPQPSSTPTPTPTSQPSASPTPTPRPSPTPTPTPLPSTTPTPQPSPSGSPSCVPTRRHPCQSRGENR